ncbi:hypothetical protein BJF88_01120 [Cellulosimicrobium sp. CUA-896]|nr:hypothetical protein BJF88_01120 [Cellulosimicrobium sp. CUA-896]
MSALDTTTVLVLSSVLVVVVAALFVLGVWRRGRTDRVDRCWSLTFLAAVLTTFAYLAAESPRLWWATALGNGAFVLSLGAIWSGARAREGRRPLVVVVAASAVLVAVLALARGPAGGPWAGGLPYLLAVATWSVLAAAELLGRARPGAVHASVLASCAPSRARTTPDARSRSPPGAPGPRRSNASSRRRRRPSSTSCSSWSARSP